MPVTEWSVSSSQNGGHLAVQVGDRVVIRLPENASTGYRWVLKGVEDACVAVEGSGVEPRQPAVGSGGDAYWVLVAGRTGSTRIELELMRPWEGERSMIDRFALDVTVRSATP